ncbi:PLD nuclease N-terminal domain-containing protein [Nocardiopsis sp. RSe5-2]|uniref:PLD nuclease N-terminal domain-containing protein n=1 Tax=Nocardiopsis endophytica TaxID=3018445 RepID=A0ABT4U451_9ACTN|nr:PLD nuclease N-terminal domain-containing protein [Nocardiopsis endophytica]MDA2811733.1 PLD nuclease N-terminal domain-containing protein [Nocardiopsis endophytica]
MLVHTAATALVADLGQVGGVALLALVAVGLLAYAAFIVGAFIGSLTSRLDAGMKVVWALFIICAPFLGALCWFVIGRRSAAAVAH